MYRNRLKQYCHVTRKDESDRLKRLMDYKAESRFRPKFKCMEVVEKDIKILHLDKTVALVVASFES